MSCPAAFVASGTFPGLRYVDNDLVEELPRHTIGIAGRGRDAMGRQFAKASAMATALLLASPALAEDEDLHQRFGAGWYCRMISVEAGAAGRPLSQTASPERWAVFIAICNSCEQQEHDFVAVNSSSRHPSGYCIERRR
jgi:hypothetical protein